MNSFDIFQNHFKIILPEFFFVSAIFIILIYGTLYNASAYYRYPILTNIIGWLSVQTLLITLFLIINCPCTGSNIISSVHTGTSSLLNGYPETGVHIPTGETAVIFNNVLIMDDFTLFVKTIVLIGAISTILISFKYTQNQKLSARANEYMILILFSTLSMLLVISSFDLISMYLAIELQSLSFYVLAAFQRNSEFSTEAGLKYFILGAISSGLLLFGESIIYGFTGLTNFEELTKLFSATYENAHFQENFNAIPLHTSDTPSFSNIPFLTTYIFNWTFIEIVNIGLVFILIAFLFKISAVPFHLWTPDVYEGAPTTVTAFFAITPKIAILALLLRLCMFTFYDLIESWQNVIIITSFLSMFIGTLGAIQQNKIKRLFAYSSIAHVGYLLISLATGTIESIEALLIYAVLYTLTIINVFSIILIMSGFSAGEYANEIVGENEREGVHGRVRARKNFGTVWVNTAASSITRLEAETKNINFRPSDLYINSLSEPTSVAFSASDWVNHPTKPKNKQTPKLPLNLLFESSEIKLFKEPSLQCEWHVANLIQGNPIWNPYQSLKQTEQGPKEKKNTAHHTAQIPQKSRYNGRGELCSELHWQPACGSVGLTTAAPPSGRQSHTCVKHTAEFCALQRANPLLAASAALIFFSNAGIPPLAGFYGKLNVFLTAVENSMYFLALTGILCSVTGAFYSIRLVKIIYFHKMSNQSWPFYQPISKENAFVLALTFFFTLFFFLSPSFLFLSAHSAAISLCL